MQVKSKKLEVKHGLKLNFLITTALIRGRKIMAVIKAQPLAIVNGLF